MDESCKNEEANSFEKMAALLQDPRVPVRFFKDSNFLRCLEKYMATFFELTGSSLYIKFDKLHEIRSSQMPQQDDCAVISASQYILALLQDPSVPVCFFKDPSFLRFLEDYKSSQFDWSRKSLYIKKFPSLHELRASQLLKQDVSVVNSASEIVVEKSETSAPDTLNKPMAGVDIRESIGNVQLSFDSSNKLPRTDVNKEEVPAICRMPPKRYLENKLNQSLEMCGLSVKDMILKKQRKFEEDLTNIKNNEELKKQRLAEMLNSVFEDFQGILTKFIEEIKQNVVNILEEENVTLRKDQITVTEDLHLAETICLDFQERYEQSRSLLTACKHNEECLKEEIADVKNRLKDQEIKCLMLQ